MPKNNKESKGLKQTTLFDSAKRLSKASKKHSTPSKTIKKKSGDAIHVGRSEPLAVASSDGEDDPSPSKLTHKRRPRRLPSESPSDPAQTSKVDTDDAGSAPRKRRLLRRLASDSPSEGNPAQTSMADTDDADSAPRKRRLLRHRRSSEGGATEVDEDPDQLVNEVDKGAILGSRLRTRNKKSSYQKNLERLKRRKLKASSPSENEDESEVEWADQEEGSSRPFKGAKPSSEVNSLEDEESESSESLNFIVEDDNVFQLPAQFSMETHQELSHQFKRIFQFFVYIAVQPPKRRSSFMKKKLADEEYFSAPLTIMRRKLCGIRDSLVASSVWKPDFKKKLEGYPEFELTELIDAVPYCDACHLGGRMSTLIGRLSGSRYKSSGFNPLLFDEEDFDELTEYHLGRFCARRTRVYHEFSHWEYELFQCISTELEELRSSSQGGFHRIAYFHGTEPPDDLTDADGLCDWLEQRQIIDREWQKLETLMESAHRLEFRSKKGEDD